MTTNESSNRDALFWWIIFVWFVIGPLLMMLLVSLGWIILPAGTVVSDYPEAGPFRVFLQVAEAITWIGLNYPHIIALFGTIILGPALILNLRRYLNERTATPPSKEV